MVQKEFPVDESKRAYVIVSTLESQTMAKQSDFRCFDESRTDDQLSETSPNMAPVAMMVDEEPEFR